MTTPLKNSTAKRPLHRWLQFGVLDLLLLTTIVAIVVALWRTPSTDVYYEPLAEGATPGQHWAGNGLRMKFRWCPPGEFNMGSPKDEKDRQDGEEQVSVTLSRGFWLGRCEVTQGEYRQVMNDSPSRFSEEGRDAALAAGIEVDRLPVANVQWDDIEEFCRRFTAQERKTGRLPEGWEYRLPTEAQWEYACRAGTQTQYSFGDDQSRLGDFAWYADNSDGRMHEVGQKLPNPWGLHDMHGNAWEWCSDALLARLVGGTDPEVAIKRAPFRVFRGGSCVYDGGVCRSANRDWSTPDDRIDDLGFRVALVQSR